MTASDRPLVPGTVDLLILRTLRDGAMHGFQVSRTLRRRSGEVLLLKDAALYQALHRLAADGLVEAEWGLSPRGKRARYYRLTRRGERRLEAETAWWRRYAGAVARVLEPTEPPAGETG